MRGKDPVDKTNQFIIFPDGLQGIGALFWKGGFFIPWY